MQNFGIQMSNVVKQRSNWVYDHRPSEKGQSISNFCSILIIVCSDKNYRIFTVLHFASYFNSNQKETQGRPHRETISKPKTF